MYGLRSRYALLDPRTRSFVRGALALSIGLIATASGVSAQEGEDFKPKAPTCAEGVITAIELDRRAVFDPTSTGFAALAWTYKALNVLHVRTTESFIRRELLLEEGDCFDPFLVSESERLLNGYGFLSDARIRSEDDGAGGRRLFVSTRDEWSTQVDVGMTYDEGPHLEKVEATEQNFLGQGVFAEFTHRERRETKSWAVGLATPRLFGRTDASIAFGQARPGATFDQYVRYPFIGETGQYSFRQGFSRRTDLFSYSSDASEAFTQVLVPAFREVAELSLARRFGDPGRSVILGVSVMRDLSRFDGPLEVTFSDDFDNTQPLPGAPPEALARQLQPFGASRVALHVGTRRYRFEEFEGLDGIRDRDLIGLGFFSGVSLGRGLPVAIPGDVIALSDYFGRVHAAFGAPLGASLLHGGFTLEARHDDGDWKDILGDVDLVAYLRASSSSAHTVFLRSSFGGGWRTELPYQLSLGGRYGVRGLPEDRYPGGRMARFVVEDRIRFGWPRRGSADLGVTLFGDVGRVWPGDVPYGLDSGWQSAVGAGLRIGLPSGTRHIWRADVAVPVGAPSGDPIFRITFELNRLRDGFYTRDVARSRRLNLGADHF